MLFNSYIFILAFLPATLVAYYLIRKLIGIESSFVVLIVASLIYYAYWKIEYLGILIISILGNFIVGQYLTGKSKTSTTKLVLGFGIAGNLAALGYYKYAGFFIENIDLLTSSNLQTLEIVLPLAISFFTFQQIAYLVDAYRGEVRDYNFRHYCLFVTFFPQLIAGPIVHHKEMLPQFIDKTKSLFNPGLFWEGLTQFVIGLFKKVVIADTVALFATPVFFAADQGSSISFTEAWIGTLAYTFQLYFDFSAYSDMAIGIGKMFGINLPANFNSPYKANSIIGFWTRWHMTLSRFLKDYLYVPLGGSRCSGLRRNINLLVTMLLGGLWHGASWNFVVWGGMHGVFIAINHMWRNFCASRQLSTESFPGYQILSKALTFLVVILAWVMFRAETFDGALRIYSGMSNFQDFAVQQLWGEALEFIEIPARATVMISICFVLAFLLPNTQEFINLLAEKNKAYKSANLRPNWLSANLNNGLAVILAGFFVMSISSMNKVSEFLYFQF